MFLEKVRVKFNVFRKRIRNLFIKPTVIFYYHRVAKVSDDPHLLSVTTENFEKQIIYLKNNFKIISLQELAGNLKNRKMKSGSVVITFDDGYADNLKDALPILEKLQIPATIFITAGKIGSSEPFYWDTETQAKDRGRPLTEDELKELSKSPFIEIGAHTMTHPHLSGLPADEQKYEIEESKRRLENILCEKVISFSYPFGGKSDFSEETISVVKKAGFQVACATTRANIQEDSPLFALPRRIIRNWTIPEFKEYIKNL